MGTATFIRMPYDYGTEFRGPQIVWYPYDFQDHDMSTLCSCKSLFCLAYVYMKSTSGFIASSKGSSTYLWWKDMFNVIRFSTN